MAGVQQVGLLGYFPEQKTALLAEKTKHNMVKRMKGWKILKIMHLFKEIHLFSSYALLSVLGSCPLAAPCHFRFIARLARRTHFYRSILKWSRCNSHLVSTL